MHLLFNNQWYSPASKYKNWYKEGKEVDPTWAAPPNPASDKKEKPYDTYHSDKTDGPTK